MTSAELETRDRVGVGPEFWALADSKSNGLSDVGFGKAGGTSSTFRFDFDWISTGFAVTGIAVLVAMVSLDSDFEPWVFRITNRHNAITSKPTTVLYARLLFEVTRFFVGFAIGVARAGDVTSLAGDVGTTLLTGPTLGFG